MILTFTDWGCSGLKLVKGEGVGDEGTWIWTNQYFFGGQLALSVTYFTLGGV